MNTFSSLGNSIVSNRKINQQTGPAFDNNLYSNVGLSFKKITGIYYGGDVNAFNNYGVERNIQTGVTRKVINLQNITTAFTGTEINPIGDNFNAEWTGYFKSDFSGLWYFYLDTDNWSNFWLGDNAISPTEANRNLADDYNLSTGENGVTLTLENGRYYPIRIQFGEQTGGQQFSFSFTRNGTNITNSTSYLYSVKPDTQNLRGNPNVFI